MSTTIYSYTIPRFLAGPVFRPLPGGAPPIRCLGYFHGCPAPALPVCRVPMPILTRVAERCCVRPTFPAMPRWFVLPPARYLLPPVLVMRR
jgi:hypothetical protein